MIALSAIKERAGSLLAESMHDNPVVTREFRTRMRGKKAFITLGGYVLFLAVALLIAFYSIASDYSGSAYGAQVSSILNRNIGQKLFSVLTWTQVILLALIIPSLASGMLSMELEKKTIELLVLTPLSSGKIVLGKQLSVFLYSMALLLSSVPLAGMCLMFGGISPAEVAVCYALVASFVFVLAAASVFWSGMFNKTAAAALFSYGTSAMSVFIPSTLIPSMMYSGGTSNPMVVNGFCVAMSPYFALDMAKVYGMHIPVSLVAIVTFAAVGTLLLLVASTHVRYRRVERALSIRLLSFIILCGLLWLFVGSIGALGVPSSAQEMLDMLTFFAVLVLSLMCLGAAVFSTGEVQNTGGKSITAYALSARKIFKSDLGGGIPFMLLLTALANAVVGASLYWIGKVEHLAFGRDFWPAFVKISIAMLPVIFTVSAVGVLSSVIAKFRREAGAVTVVFSVLLFGAYGILLMAYQEGVSNASGGIWQLAALWPLTPVLKLTDNWHDLPQLYWSAQNSWIVTVVCFTVLGSLVLMLASSAAKKFAGVKED